MLCFRCGTRAKNVPEICPLGRDFYHESCMYEKLFEKVNIVKTVKYHVEYEKLKNVECHLYTTLSHSHTLTHPTHGI